MDKRFRFLLLLLCLETLANDLHFGQFVQDDGLSQGTVRSIVQDREGYLWFATQSGLNRFDGREFKVFFPDPEDPDSIGDVSIRVLHLDQKGQLWLGHGSGLDLYEAETSSFRHYRSGIELLDGVVTCIEEDDEGHIWVGYAPHGLSRLDPESGDVTHYSFDPFTDMLGDGGLGVSTLCWDDDQLLVAAGMGYMYRLRKGGQLEQIDLPGNGVSRFSISSLMKDKKGQLWIGTRGAGVFLYDALRSRIENFAEMSVEDGGIDMLQILSFYEDEEGRIWVGGEDGLRLLDVGASRFRAFRRQPSHSFSLVDNKIFDIYGDRTGVLWFGTNNGISKINPIAMGMRHIFHQTDGAGLSHDRVKSIFQDDKKRWWVGTFGGGLDIFDPQLNKIKSYRHKDEGSIHSDVIYAIHEDPDGRYWVGSFGAGLAEFIEDEDRFIQHVVPSETDQSSSGNKITIIRDWKDGKLWIGSWLGLMDFDTENEAFTLHGDGPNGWGRNMVRTIHGGSDGLWWVGAYLKGLYSYNAETGEIVHYPLKNSADRAGSDLDLMCIIEDRNRNLWVGGNSGGLIRFDRHTGEADYVLNNFINATVYGILEDESGFLWLSGNHGLSRFNPKDESIIHLGVQDGLQGKEFNGGAWFKGLQGELAFGGTAGLNIFDPNGLIPEKRTMPLTITSVQILGKEPFLPKVGDQIELESSDKVLIMNFAAMDYTNPEETTYSYRLKGFDQDWRGRGFDRSATYTNLDPGPYEFWVKSTHANGVWESDLVKVPIYVHPPFYRSFWFYGLVALILMGLLVGWDWRHNRNRIKLEQMVESRTLSLQSANERLEETAANLRATQRKLLESAHLAGQAEIATDILHNIGNALNGIQVSVDLIDEQTQKFRLDVLNKIADLLEASQEEMAAAFNDRKKAEDLPKLMRMLIERMGSSREMATKEIQTLQQRLIDLNGILNSQRKYVFNRDYVSLLNPRSILEDILHIQDAVFKEHNIRVICDLREVPDIAVSKSKLIHIVNNLVRNACDSLQTVRDRHGRILKICLAEGDEGMVLITIEDNGAGIDAPLLNRIFAQGFTTKENKTGVGLHYCATAVEEIGGRIEVDSEGAGLGARFRLFLPVMK